MFNLFDAKFESFLENNDLQQYKNLLFRLRNMRLLVENHIGNVKNANQIILNQNGIISNLASNPENF